MLNLFLRLKNGVVYEIGNREFDYERGESDKRARDRCLAVLFISQTDGQTDEKETFYIREIWNS